MKSFIIQQTKWLFLTIALLIIAIGVIFKVSVATNKPDTLPALIPANELSEFVVNYAKRSDARGMLVKMTQTDGLHEQSPSAYLSIVHGFNDADGSVPVQSNMHFYLGQATEALVAQIIFELVQTGLLDLDAPVRTYLPTVVHGDIVTIRRLLDHTSGMPDFMRSQDWQRQVEADPQAAWQIEDVLSFIAGQGLGFIPGSEYRYSPTNYVLLAAVIETVLAQPLSQVMQQTLQPALAQTGVAAQSPQPRLNGYRYAHPQYLFKPGPSLTDVSAWTTNWSLGAGSAYSKVDDMILFAHGYLSTVATQIDNIDWVETRDRGWRYAQGVWLYEGALVLRGDWHGHSVMVGYVPEYAMAFAVASNLSLTRSGTAPAQYVGRAIIEKLYGMR